MNKYIVNLTREYVVEIEANDEDSARNFTELYISGGIDESNKSIRIKNNFKFINIKPTLNECFYVEKINDLNV